MADQAKVVQNDVLLPILQFASNHLSQAVAGPFNGPNIDGFPESLLDGADRSCFGSCQLSALAGNLGIFLGNGQGSPFAETKPCGVIESLNRLDQGIIALAHHVGKIGGPHGMTAGNAHHQTEIGLHNQAFQVVRLGQVGFRLLEHCAGHSGELDPGPQGVRHVFVAIVLSKQEQLPVPAEHRRALEHLKILGKQLLAQRRKWLKGLVRNLDVLTQILVEDLTHARWIGKFVAGHKANPSCHQGHGAPLVDNSIHGAAAAFKLGHQFAG